MLDGDGGQETQAAEVDGEKRDIAAVNGAGRRKKSAVAAEDNNQLRAIGDVIPGDAVFAIQVLRGDKIETHLDAARFEPSEKFGEDVRGRIDVGF